MGESSPAPYHAPAALEEASFHVAFSVMDAPRSPVSERYCKFNFY